jgi:hypothetical protein
VVNSFAMFVLAVLALWLKMDAEETSVVRLDWYATSCAISRSFRDSTENYCCTGMILNAGRGRVPW